MWVINKIKFLKVAFKFDEMAVCQYPHNIQINTKSNIKKKKENLCIPIPYQIKVLFSVVFVADTVEPLTVGSQPKVLQGEANCTLWTGNTLFLDQICENG